MAHSNLIMKVQGKNFNVVHDEFISSEAKKFIDSNAGKEVNAVTKMFLREAEIEADDFKRSVKNAVDNAMIKFSEEIDIMHQAAEFEDETDIARGDYENDMYHNIILLPNGNVISEGRISRKYFHLCAIDGKVYSTNSGRLHTLKRTKFAKKCTYYEEVSVHSIKSFKRYVAESGYDRYNGMVGHWYNPYALYDYYLIGGYWSHIMLVKDDVKEFIGEAYNDDRHYVNPPKGYKYASAARKKDIEYNMMRKFVQENAETSYNLIKGLDDREKIIEILRDNGFGYIDMAKIKNFDDYVKEVAPFIDKKYLMDDRDCLIDDEVIDNYDVDKFINDADDDDIIVSIDYHC